MGWKATAATAVFDHHRRKVRPRLIRDDEQVQFQTIDWPAEFHLHASMTRDLTTGLWQWAVTGSMGQLVKAGQCASAPCVRRCVAHLVRRQARVVDNAREFDCVCSGSVRSLAPVLSA